MHNIIMERLLSLDPSEVLSYANESGKHDEFIAWIYQALYLLDELPNSASDVVNELPRHKVPEHDKYGIFLKDVRVYLSKYLKEYRSEKKPILLDLGGGLGEVQNLRNGFEYWLIDIEPGEDADKVIKHDITEGLPFDNNSLDIIYSNQVLEHIKQPINIVKEINRVLKNSGLCLLSTVFSYRYHPFPEDYWRFTHAGLKYLLEYYGMLETLENKYELTHRRDDRRGSYAGGLDAVPVDWFGGFRENWFVYYIGKKVN